MKKALLTATFVVGAFLTANAQSSTSNSALSEGSWLVEANTNFGRAHAANTSFSLNTSDDYTAWNIGFEGGYFIMDDLALKAGLGYGDSDNSDGNFSYKVGAKYYVVSQFPVQIDFNGSTGDDYSPLFLGLQGGYAWFVANNIALEPGIRYDIDINDDADGASGLSLNVGFSLFF
ncbi:MULTISPECIES: hypothetical protein [Galbibacter]|uniref:Outer membrane protein beta-barrel domain-containing protein n=1 Tax=Galbibacter pacificus TaxID=2996052 RepID=A0ABT6FPH9_9FLAO|nr:hypothetical protein [Galbibacter pacificus]MDG3582359.1 hypothetical protein [Galbibacter pacificus]MDG3585165.1 hypothetical protein [Galbibacter pacificus]